MNLHNYARAIDIQGVIIPELRCKFLAHVGAQVAYMQPASGIYATCITTTTTTTTTSTTTTTTSTTTTTTITTTTSTLSRIYNEFTQLCKGH